jgi:hypothetical protein
VTNYTSNTLLQLTVLITDQNNNPVAPTGIQLKIQDPMNNITSLQSSIVTTGVGAYSANYLPTLAGSYTAEWIATGSAQVATMMQFTVSPAIF